MGACSGGAGKAKKESLIYPIIFLPAFRPWIFSVVARSRDDVINEMASRRRWGCAGVGYVLATKTLAGCVVGVVGERDLYVWMI